MSRSNASSISSSHPGQSEGDGAQSAEHGHTGEGAASAMAQLSDEQDSRRRQQGEQRSNEPQEHG